jgi:epoxyqueuosine reductase QueG
MSISLAANPGQSIIELINSTVQTTDKNRLYRLDNSPIFGSPLVGFALGDDPVFDRFKTVIAPFHMTPTEALSLGSGSPVLPSATRVISWVLPIVSRTRASNRDNTRRPSFRWAHTRAYGDAVHMAVREALLSAIKSAGYRAVAPTTLPNFRTEELANGPASAWSERHMAYAAGLGTFGLSDGLITAKGKAHRLGSIVTDLPLEATPRPYQTHTAYCLHLSGYECGKCIGRCPAGAINEKGHDKIACRAYAYGTLNSFADKYDLHPPGCGLCQTGVPCEYQIPPQLR